MILVGKKFFFYDTLKMKKLQYLLYNVRKFSKNNLILYQQYHEDKKIMIIIKMEIM